MERVNQGAFHESLNLASLWSIPVIYIIENNQYSMGDEPGAVVGDQGVAGAAGGCLQYRVGCDQRGRIFTRCVRGRRRRWSGRTMSRGRVCWRSIRIGITGHSVADANAKKYRSADEIEYYKSHHDPIQLWQKQLVSEGDYHGGGGRRRSTMPAAEEAEAAAKFAEESPLPNREDIFSDVYYEVDQKTDAGRQGKHFFNE